jgi:hypothetical protein
VNTAQALFHSLNPALRERVASYEPDLDIATLTHDALAEIVSLAIDLPFLDLELEHVNLELLDRYHEAAQRRRFMS